MGEKRNTTKFTVQFNPQTPTHLKAIKILNSVPPRGKAQLITDALLFYNQAYNLVDVSVTDDVVINVPEPTASKKPAKEKIKSFEDEYNETLSLQDFDDEEDDFDIEDEDEDDGVFDDIFAQSLMSMGLKPMKKDEE